MKRPSFLEYATEKIPGFVADHHALTLGRILTLYFTRDRSFETEGFGSLEKGLWIEGNIGVGKTEITRLFRNSDRGRFDIVPCQMICDEYETYGLDAVMRYVLPNQEDSRRQDFFLFDDIGSEQLPVNYMGNKKNVLEWVISKRYDRRATIPFWKTIFTSNLTPGAVKDRYGERVVSRLAEITNCIRVTGPDRRLASTR